MHIPFTKREFRLLENAGKLLGTSRGHHEYGITQYSDLDNLLGIQWHFRVANINGDFSLSVLETIQFYLMKPKLLLDFNATKTTAGELS